MKIFENGRAKDVLFSIRVSTIVFVIICLIFVIVIGMHIKNAVSKTNGTEVEHGSDYAMLSEGERDSFNRGFDVSARSLDGARTVQNEENNPLEVTEEVQDTNVPVEQVTTAGELLSVDVPVVTVEKKEEPAQEENTEDNSNQNQNQNQDGESHISIDQVTISVDMDLTQRTGLSREDFITLMAGVKADTSGFFEENAGLIYDMCEKYQLNEIFFCGLISAESGWTIAGNHRRTHNYISLMSGSGLIQFASLEEGMEKAAKTLHDRYLTPGGSFYYGKTLNAVRTKFCPANPGWTNLVYGRMQQIVK